MQLYWSTPVSDTARILCTGSSVFVPGIEYSSCTVYVYMSTCIYYVLYDIYDIHSLSEGESSVRVYVCEDPCLKWMRRFRVLIFEVVCIDEQTLSDAFSSSQLEER